jgi:choline-glycine betaine transporter
MVLMSSIVIAALYLACSRYGELRLGREGEVPEFSNITWITMMFAAGMGVGLLYWSAAEPLSHFSMARQYVSDAEAARLSLFMTNFHWGIHAWATAQS